MAASRSSLLSLIRLLARRLQLLSPLLPGRYIFQALKNAIPKLLSNPHVAEILRFVFLGTVVEWSRLAGQKLTDIVKHCTLFWLFQILDVNFSIFIFSIISIVFIVEASFTRNDFAFDWVKRYLEENRVWDHSRIFRVAACDPALRHSSHAGLGEDFKPDGNQDLTDGRPHPVYQPAPKEPELFQWRGHWISVSMNMDSEPGVKNESVQVLTLR